MANGNLPPYRPIDVSFLGGQKVDSELNDVSYWRNNLVAASKYHNYLFIAVRSQVRVYAPKYPYQTIPATSSYTTLTSAVSPHASGFIDTSDPHAINSITVGELGFEEVLVSAHDDGDVCAWYTRDLRRMAFRLSVGISAWGVALHKERRLLAVSANSHDIQVFELAIGRNPDDLDDEDEDGVDEEVFGDEDCGSRKRRRRRRTESRSPDESTGEEDDESWADPSSHKRRRRKSPVKDKTVKTLSGHCQNIPNISFLDDPTGRWLVGTSIDGIVILWDVKTERPVEQCKLGYILAGWSVLFLKPQAFKPVSTLHEALGKPLLSHTAPTAEPRKIPIGGIHTLPTDYYDPPTNQRFREARAWDISPPFLSSSGEMGLLQLDEGYDEDHYASEDDDESTDADADAEVEVFIGSGGGHVEFVTDEESETDTSVSNSDSTASSEAAGFTSYYSFAPEVESSVEGNTSDRALPGVFGPVRVVELVQDSEGEAGTDSREKRTRETNTLRERNRRRRSNSDEQTDDEVEDDDEERPAQPPISFVFSTTEQNCHLLTLTPSLTPTVICRSPLHQPHPLPSLQYLGNIDRLNMVHCIPELSLVIAASQKGRAAIFRLTRVADTFCMRLDTVLPREISSDSGRGLEQRPSAALLGVAVGPVQERRRTRSGGLGVCGRRRWRLMMVYMDGNVVSYELGREEPALGAQCEGGGGAGGFVMV